MSLRNPAWADFWVWLILNGYPEGVCLSELNYDVFVSIQDKFKELKIIQIVALIVCIVIFCLSDRWTF